MTTASSPSTCRQVNWARGSGPTFSEDSRYASGPEVKISPTGAANGCNEQGGAVFEGQGPVSGADDPREEGREERKEGETS